MFGRKSVMKCFVLHVTFCPIWLLLSFYLKKSIAKLRIFSETCVMSQNLFY